MNHTLGVLYKKSPPQVTKIVSYAFVGLGFYVKTYDPFELECTVTYGLNVLHVGTQLFSTVSGTNFPSLPFCLFASTESSCLCAQAQLWPSLPLVCLPTAMRCCQSVQLDS